VRQAVRRSLRSAALRPGRRAESDGRREELALRYLRGEGIEIGALHRPLWLPRHAHARYVDFMSREDLLEVALIPANPRAVVATDVIDDGSRLEKFGEESLDFVVANRVLEHIEDPVAALENWIRVLRRGGVLLLSLPDASYHYAVEELDAGPMSFDVRKPRTSIENVLRDHREVAAMSREQHYREDARFVRRFPDEPVEERGAEIAGQEWPINYVWEPEGFLDLLRALQLPARLEHAQLAAAEFLIVLRKVEPKYPRRAELAVLYLRGEGIEIGAFDRPLRLPRHAHARYVDFMSRDELLKVCPVPTDPRAVVPTDVIDDGSRLEKFGEESLDFVIANHVLEHIEDPVAALENWIRVLRRGGVLLLSLPDARYTSFDVQKPRTSIEHVLRDHRESPAASREQHYREHARFAEKFPDERVEERAAEVAGQEWPIHFHVWELEGFIDLLRALQLPARLEHSQLAAAEFSIVLRKDPPPAT
jgi:predicted SAM-dependent methyltransferase